MYVAKEHSFLYGLHTNGSLYRYTVTTAPKSFGSAPAWLSAGRGQVFCGGSRVGVWRLCSSWI